MPFMIEDPNTGTQVELTSDNAMILIFPGDELDHVAVRTDTSLIIAYDRELLQLAMVSREFPMVLFPFIPSFAVERRAARETPDFERLLDE